jgi:hypothetical protein
MRNLLLLFAGVCALSAVAACQKSEDTQPAPAATIQIAAPFANQSYAPGDTVTIKGFISGNTTLHGYHIAIVDRQTGDSVFQAASHAHGLVLEIKEQWVNQLTSATDLRLYISSAINHDGLEAVKTVDFSSRVN